MVIVIYIPRFRYTNNIFSTQEMEKCLEVCYRAIFSAICGHFVTEREDSQNTYIITEVFQVGF